MATAHGAGFMLIPVLLGLSSAEQMHGPHAHGAHTDHAAITGSATLVADLAVVGLHTLAMFVVMGVIAMVVYEKLGVMILKRTWFNLDLLWAGALVGAGFITLIV
jgi:hypothetical protein